MKTPRIRLPIDSKSFFLLHGTLFLYAVAGILGKYAGIALHVHDTFNTVLFVGLELLVLMIYTVLWQQVLSRMPLHFAYSNKGICTLWAYLLSVLLLHETMTLGKAIGILVVLIGVYLVATDHE